jgi:hypothetical protein
MYIPHPSLFFGQFNSFETHPFQMYDDKFWSYTDCSILVMSQKLGIPEIFAFDEHIRQMKGLGILCLPAHVT